MAATVFQTSFAAGELSPGLAARVDFQKYRSGCSLALNTFVDVRGGLSNRPGTSFVGRSKQTFSVTTGNCDGTAPRLIPFQFSTLQAYVLEMGDEYMRVIMNGGYVLETAKTITAITKANPGVVTSAAHGFVAGDWVFITGVVGMTQLNGRSFIVGTVATNTFQLHTLDDTPLDTTLYTTYVSGGTAARYFELATPYLIADVPLLKYAQSADVLTITHPLYPPADITRTGNASWTYTPITFAPDILPPAAAPTVTSSGAGSTTYRYVVTSVSFATSEESRPGPIGSVTGITMSQNVGANNKIKWLPVAGASYYNVYRQPEVIGGAADYGQIYGFIGTTTGVSITDQNIAPDFSRSPPQPRNPFLNRTIQDLQVLTGGSGYTTGAATASGGGGTGWIGFIEATGGVVTAVVTQYGGQDYTSAPTISAAGGTGLTVTATIGPADGNYPGCVSYFQQRKCFAASLNFPETFWMTQIGNFNNFDVSVPARDSDAVTGTIASTQVNAIKYLLPQASGLIAGSSSGAWQISGGTLGEPVTPSNIVASPQVSNGASDVPPLPINNEILFVQNKSNVVRDMTYNFYTNNFLGNDVSVLANHLFYGFAITEWAYQDEPTKIVWAIRNDGALLSFTFLKEQEVLAWTHHDTQGDWCSVVTIPEGDEDAVYLIARRTISDSINSGKPVFYVERMQSRQMARPWTGFKADPTNAWFLDCALQYSFITPPACMRPSDDIITTDSPAFNYVSVGYVIRFTVTYDAFGRRLEDGVDFIFTVTEVVSSTVVRGVYVGGVGPAALQEVLIPEGDWTLTAAVQTVTGLDHLEGASVMILSNGSVQGPQVVVNGAVTLEEPSDIVVVGLQYFARGTNMFVDLGGGAPSVAGKRKTQTGLTCYLENSRGLSFSGSGFDNLVAIKERTNEVMGQPTRLLTGEFRPDAIFTDWTVEGQTYWYSEWPLPFTLLGLAGEFTFGDNTGGR